MKTIRTSQLRSAGYFHRASVTVTHGDHYVIDLYKADQQYRLVKANAKPLVCHHLNEVREMIAAAKIGRSVLVHDISFDEMIGLPYETATTQEEPLFV